MTVEIKVKSFENCQSNHIRKNNIQNRKPDGNSEVTREDTDVVYGSFH